MIALKGDYLIMIMIMIMMMMMMIIIIIITIIIIIIIIIITIIIIIINLGPSRTKDFKLTVQCLPCQTPYALWPEIQVVGPMSGHCDPVRKQIWSAASFSLWQHAHLPKQIHPRDGLGMLLGH